MGGLKLLGYGTLLTGSELLLGDWAKDLTIHVIELEYPFLLAILPPGAFIIMGFIIAAKNRIDTTLQSFERKTEKVQRARARVTSE